MKKVVIGILAHVDAGKTTLSESLLYLSGKIKKIGRVDNKDAYLDNYQLEKARGITIFSKQAVFDIGDKQIILLDTPGHVDFSAEMERTLQVLDYAILVISGADGIQGHTKTLWKLLEIYNIPVFLFINKTDQNNMDKNKLIIEIKKQLDDGCIDFKKTDNEEFYEQISMCDEKIMETYLEGGKIENNLIRKAVLKRRIFPCFFGSALKLEGIEKFMEGISKYSVIPTYTDEFGAKIFKITRDEQDNRLTHIKLTGGKLKVRDALTNGVWEEKVNQIRIYSGEKFEAVNEVEAGEIFAVTGLSQARPGEGLGIEQNSNIPILEPVLRYQIILPEGIDPRAMLPKLYMIEEEHPELHIVWNEQLQEIQAKVMGEIQVEILQSLIKDRFNVDITVGDGKIVYKETISNIVEGVGHFEPLRHYAEVHLLLEPGEMGSGLKFKTKCSEDMLSQNWQRLILTHLKEKEHKGVLTGSPITDMKIILVAGKAHNKHTEGGDFREATYRALRQGLKEAESVLLEPYYTFYLELPEKMVGRAMTDIEKMHGAFEISQSNAGMSVLVGSAPVSTMRNYQKEVLAYTKGFGRLFCNLEGYKPCHNQEEAVESIAYHSERDMENPTGSIFFEQGAGFYVEWNKVKQFMHVESYFKTKANSQINDEQKPMHPKERTISLEEIDRIIDKTFYANQGKKSSWKKRKTAIESYYKSPICVEKRAGNKEKYLLVDGYNIIYAWSELKELIEENMDAAKMRLLDLLSNYQWIKRIKIIVVFDAYRVEGHREEIIDYYNIHMVYTREAQTADEYIEKFAHDNKKNYDITVATSDGLQQMIVRGEGCALLSAKDLKTEIIEANKRLQEEYEEKKDIDRNYLMDSLPPKVKKQMENIIKRDGGKV